MATTDGVSMSAEDRAAVKGGLTDAQFNDLLRVVRETVREEMRAEFEGRRRVNPSQPLHQNYSPFVRFEYNGQPVVASRKDA